MGTIARVLVGGTIGAVKTIGDFFKSDGKNRTEKQTERKNDKDGKKRSGSDTVGRSSGRSGGI